VKVDFSKAHNGIIVRNHAQDASYAPYCMRCNGMHRMQVIEPFLFQHHCGAVHDERQVIEQPTSHCAGVSE